MAQQNFDEDVQSKAFDGRLARKSLTFVLPHWRLLLISLACMMSVSGALLVQPLLTKSIIDEGVKGKNVNTVMLLGLALLGVCILRTLAASIQTYRLNLLGNKVVYDLRHTLFSHMQRLSLSFFDKREIGRLISRLTGDVGAVNELVTSSALSLITDVFTLIGVVIIMVRMNLTLSLILFCLTPLMFLATVIFKGKSRLAYREVRRKMATVTASVAENVTGVRVVKSFSREGENLQRFQQVNKENQKAAVHARLVNTIFIVLISIVGGMAGNIIFWYGGRQVIAKTLTIGELMAFFLLVDRLMTPVRSMSQTFQTIQSAMAGAERIFEILDTEPVVDDKPDAVDLPVVRGEIEFKDVNFAYSETPILKDINLVAHPGETIALVGQTGAGKTTIINLLGRQYDVRSGSIKIDGMDLRDVTLKSLRTQMGIVLQDSFLFPATVKENIRYGRLDATDQEVEEAARMVGVHDFILSMPNGYDTVIQEGGHNLSAGQKQLLSFARAILANPRVLILDEATSSVDAATELLIQEALKTLFKGRTSFVIAHRLSTISEADKIIVLDQGQIVESGTHKELLAADGHYRKLYDAQFAYDKSEDEAVEISRSIGVME